MAVISVKNLLLSNSLDVLVFQPVLQHLFRLYNLLYIQGVTGGTDQTSGGYSLC